MFPVHLYLLVYFGGSLRPLFRIRFGPRRPVAPVVVAQPTTTTTTTTTTTPPVPQTRKLNIICRTMIKGMEGVLSIVFPDSLVSLYSEHQL